MPEPTENVAKLNGVNTDAGRNFDLFYPLFTLLMANGSAPNYKVDSLQTEVAELKGRLDVLEKLILSHRV